MKKQSRLLAAASIIFILATITLTRFMHASAQFNDSAVMHQTWEEFLESGVQLEFDDTLAVETESE